MRHRPQSRHGFTMIELLVTIGIIVVLISILIPVVSRVQTSARVADTSAFISQLSSAIDRYYQDFRAYPGPMHNDEIRRDSFIPTTYNSFRMVTPWPAEFYQPTADNGVRKITMSENLVLGLLGGLRADLSGGVVDIVYDPRLVGGGPMNLHPAQPKRLAPYMDGINLSWNQLPNGRRTGAFFDEGSVGGDENDPVGADDSVIPEFVDRFSDPMPIIYLRARVGTVITGTTFTPQYNAVITNVPNPTVGSGRIGQYDLSQIIGYTQTPTTAGVAPIGVGKKPPAYYVDGAVVPTPQPPEHGLNSVTLNRVMGPPGSPTYNYPYNAFPYFRDPGMSSSQTPTGSGYAPPHVARQKDRYILISAGPDRIYGTNDDITNFGSVTP